MGSQAAQRRRAERLGTFSLAPANISRFCCVASLHSARVARTYPSSHDGNNRLLGRGPVDQWLLALPTGEPAVHGYPVLRGRHGQQEEQERRPRDDVRMKLVQWVREQVAKCYEN